MEPTNFYLLTILSIRYYCEQWLEGAPNRVTPNMDNDICMERNKCLRSYFPVAKERLEAYAEIAKFASASGELAQYDCSQHRWDLEPRDWWVMYGAALPRLQPIALKLLAQPSSSSCCERNWSTYSFIHSTKRNKLNPTRANDLVFIHTNLRLLARKRKSYMEGETKMWDVGLMHGILKGIVYLMLLLFPLMNQIWRPFFSMKKGIMRLTLLEFECFDVG